VTLIDQHADHLNEVTTRLLRTARIDNADLKLKREKIDLTHATQHCLGRQTTPGDGAFQLIDSAAKYGSPDSSITIEVQEEPAETLISIRNEGSFIPPHEREKIFERFYRSPGSDRRASGTGIGLSVVKRITEAHQGRAWVNSAEHTGTTFFVALPRTAKEMQTWHSD
jgi:two-component system sensor histidine kinase KdpD